ncbi:MAG TPA: amidohydrolase family protein [Steroidobacteraceae bacterium]|nr:amidohydrolase family protein [Steroidobacteraceae bacterium]
MRGLTFVNADMGPRLPSTLRIEGSRIASIGAQAVPRDRVVDLDGDRLLPGLINAHDHLQLNSFPTPHYGRKYRNAGEWIADLNSRFLNESAFVACKAIPRDARLLHGGIKNLLSGVTTVVHHDPLYPVLTSTGYPTQVLDRYGWSHSLEIDGPQKVQAAHRHTPAGWPWIIHAAEGVDAPAAAELDRLDALGCLGPNTLLVHGVALDRNGRAKVERAAAGLVWCPSSNLRLFDATAEVTDLAHRGRVALGTDSRLSGARDLLDELRVAAELGVLDEPLLQSLVTDSSARLLRLTDRGALRPGARADLVVFPANTPLTQAARKDVRLVVSGGSVRCGDPDYASQLMAESRSVAVRVDGRNKCIASEVDVVMSDPHWACLEPGVEVLGRAA